MRYIDYERIVEEVEALCISAAYELGEDVLSALKAAMGKESSPAAKKIIEQVIEKILTYIK